MYVAKKLADVKAVQTLSRLNRIATDHQQPVFGPGEPLRQLPLGEAVHQRFAVVDVATQHKSTHAE